LTLRNDYTVTPINTGSYTQLTADSGANEIKELQIFDSSGEDLVLALGASGSEVDKLYIFPGGNNNLSVNIPANSRISVRAVSANASVGKLIINCLG